MSEASGGHGPKRSLNLSARFRSLQTTKNSAVASDSLLQSLAQISAATSGAAAAASGSRSDCSSRPQDRRPVVIAQPRWDWVLVQRIVCSWRPSADASSPLDAEALLSMAQKDRQTWATWTFPSSTAATAKTTSVNVEQRRERWEESLRSVYWLWRHSSVATYFYVYDRTRRLVFLLVRGDELHQAVALVSSSTGTLRSSLEAHDVDFTMPFSQRMTDERVEATFTNEALQLDGDVESLLFIEGFPSVHALYDFLINRNYVGDVPELVASFPFEHGTMSIPFVASCSRVHQGDETGVVLELMSETPILPNVVLKVCQWLPQAFGIAEQSKMQFDYVDVCRPFNLILRKCEWAQEIAAVAGTSSMIQPTSVENDDLSNMLSTSGRHVARYILATKQVASIIEWSVDVDVPPLSNTAIAAPLSTAHLLQFE